MGRYEQWKVQLQEERGREIVRDGEHHSVSMLQYDAFNMTFLNDKRNSVASPNL